MVAQWFDGARGFAIRKAWRCTVTQDMDWKTQGNCINSRTGWERIEAISDIFKRQETGFSIENPSRNQPLIMTLTRKIIYVGNCRTPYFSNDELGHQSEHHMPRVEIIAGGESLLE